MARIEVTFNELYKSFRNFRKHAPQTTKDECCLLDALYAAECGIKAIIIKENLQYRSTKDIQLKNGHDILEMLSQCQYPPLHNLPLRLNVTANQGIRDNNVALSSLHTALRYGAPVLNHHRVKCAEKMDTLLQWIEKNIKARA